MTEPSAPTDAEIARRREVLARFGASTRAWFDESFAAPTAVQAQGWPRIVDGEHVLMVAPTGSGKTLAAFLAAIDRVVHQPVEAERGVRILYVSPLKALAYDIERNLRAPLVGIRRTAEQTGTVLRPVAVDLRTGDTPQKERARQKRKPNDILVTTPESLYLLLTSQARETLRTVQTVILDEIHVMSGTKRGVHLALSLERLAALCEHDPQRVGLSATQRPLDGAARFLGGDRDVSIVDTSEPPRLDLSIVVPVPDMENPSLPAPAGLSGDDDAFDLHDLGLDEGLEPEEGAPPDLDDPFADDDGLPTDGPSGGGPSGPVGASGSFQPNQMQHGIWPSIHPKLLALIRSHRSTLLFVNSRLLCERLAAALNELAGEDLVRAHHGSISHERRAEIEEALKGGRIPCIVATSSLELGIDMGAVDLVILVESPGSTARGLQRIGRAGHQVGEVSQGRIFPKYRGDLLECAVVSARMARGDIEATTTPRNCLDVLAQQVVAMVSQQDWEVHALHDLVRRASPYRELSKELLGSVLDMLSGRYPSDAFAELTPSVTWDRVDNTLTSTRGAKMLAILNGGTIPDRGLYRVHLGEGGPRLGELDEEMVFESREGDAIILGASTWRITGITRDRVYVEPAPGQPGRLPFWRGERPGRPLELGRDLGRFLRELSPMEDEEAEAWLVEHTPLDALAARNLVAYVSEQRDSAGGLPTDRSITVERFRDELGDWRVCILTPFGSRVHQPWALALESTLSARAGFDVQCLSSDDGIALRFADDGGTGESLPDLDALFPDPEDLDDLVLEQLRHSAIFAARFRENAGRALLLPKRRPRGRTPLWLQRKKAQSLLATCLDFPSFPIVLETYRECLQDVFDLPSLRELLTAIRRREIRVHEVETRQASPFARSLVFQYIAAYLYDGDAPLAERKAQALALDRDLLRELLGQAELRELLDAEAVEAVELELQALTDTRRARHPDALHNLLRRLGDLSRVELAARCAEDGDPEAWLDALLADRRVLELRIGGEPRIVAIEDAGRYREALGIVLPPGVPAAFLDPSERPLESLLARWARTHGPFHPEQLARRYGLTVANVEALLRGMEDRGTMVQGELRPGGTRREWCDAEVMRLLRRRSLAKLRREVEPVAPDVMARFLPEWQRLGSDGGAPMALLQDAVDALEGLAIPWSALEREVLPARVPGYQPMLLDQLGAMGEILWVGRGSLGTKDGKVALYRRESVDTLVQVPPDDALPDSPVARALRDHLVERGASFLVELSQAAPDASSAEVQEALWDLVWAGFVTNDTFQPLRGLSGPRARSRTRRRGRRGRRPRSGRVRMAGGRWSAIATLSTDPADPTERALAQASVLLERYGVVGRPVADVEGLAGGWSAQYPVFKAMEESGQVRRGYFVDGYGGAQFALPGAVDRLRAWREPEGDVRILAASDPAQAWGSLLPWPALHGEGQPRRIAGARVVTVAGEPILYLGSGTKRILLFQRGVDEEQLLESAVAAVRQTVGYRSVSVSHVDTLPALEHPLVGRLVRAGFERDYGGLLLTRV